MFPDKEEGFNPRAHELQLAGALQRLARALAGDVVDDVERGLVEALEEARLALVAVCARTRSARARVSCR